MDLFECQCNSTKVLIEDTIVTSHTGLPFYMVIPAMGRFGSLQGKGSIYKTCTPFPFCYHKKMYPPPLHFTLPLKISLLQKSAIHVLSNSVYGSYTASLFAKLKILEIFLVFLCYMLLNLCSAIIIICCLLLF